MMRPVKLAGSELMFGKGCLEYIKTLHYKRVCIVVGGSSMQRSGMLDKVTGYFQESGAQVRVISGVEPDPSIATVRRGAKEMLEFEPDLIVGMGGGSAMDAGKTMWVFYEHPELTKMEDILPPNPFPTLRHKAKYCCIPSTSGSASEVSRSVVITDDEGMKRGLGNMEMMPDIAICDPEVCASMPPRITAETGMDALTHALEALVSNRAHYLSDVLAQAAAKDIIDVLPVAYADGSNLDAREIIARSNAQAWNPETDDYISIAKVEYDLKEEEGQYPVTFATGNGTSIERMIFVVNQPFVKNEKANEAVMAFNFLKTVDEIQESQALDTDIKTWANAQGWKLSDEDQSVDISVDYDFDPEQVTEGVYKITFSTTGREFKIHTTDYSEVGQEVGLTFFPEDIHVMSRMAF